MSPIPIYAELKKELSESLSMNDSIFKLTNKELLDSFSFSDTILKDMDRTLNESYNLSDAVSVIRTFLRTYSESFSFNDIITKQTTKLLAESNSLSDNFSRVWTLARIYSENFSLSDSELNDISRSLSESYGLSDAETAQIYRTILESNSLSDSVLKSEERSLSENITISDGDFYYINKILSEIFGFSDAYSRIWNLARNYTQEYNLSDTENNSIVRILTEENSLSDNFSRVLDVARTYLEEISTSDLIKRDIERTLSEYFTFDDGDMPIFVTKLLTEEFGMADTYSRIWNLARTYSESINSSDFFLNIIFDSLKLEAERADIQAIITDQGISATLIRQTETTDIVGGVTAVSEQEYTIYMSIQDILREDRQIHDMGLAFPGEAKVFLFHEYPDSITGNGDVVVQVGDMIKDDEDKYWRVEKINAERDMNGGEIFKSAIIKRIDLDQWATHQWEQIFRT